MKRSLSETADTHKAAGSCSPGSTAVEAKEGGSACSIEVALPPRKRVRVKLSKAELFVKLVELGEQADATGADLSVLSESTLPSWVPKRCVHFVIENYHAKEAVAGVWKWLSNRAVMHSLLFSPSFYSLSGHKKLKK